MRDGAVSDKAILGAPIVGAVVFSLGGEGGVLDGKCCERLQRALQVGIGV